MYRRVAVVGRGALAVPRVRGAQRSYSQRPNPDEAPEEEEVQRPRSRRTINTSLLSTLGAKPAEPPKPPPPPPPPEVQPAAKQTTATPSAPPAASERAARSQNAQAAAPAAQKQQQQPAQAKKPTNVAQPAPAPAKAAKPQQPAQAKGPVEKKLIDTLAAAQKASSQPAQKQAPKAAPAQQPNAARASQKPESDAKAAPASKQQQRQQPGMKIWTPQQATAPQEKAAQPKPASTTSKSTAEQPSLAARLKQAAAAAAAKEQAKEAAPSPSPVAAKAPTAAPSAPTQEVSKAETTAKPAPSAEPVAADATPVSAEATTVKAAEADAPPTEAAVKPDEYQPIGPTTKMPEESTRSSEPRGKSPRHIFEEFMKTYTGPKVLVEDLQVQEPDTRNPLVELELDHLSQSVQRDVMNAGWSPTLAHLQPAVIRKVALRIAQREGKMKMLPKYVKRMSGFMHMTGAKHAPRYPNDRVKPQRSAEGAREKLWRAQVRRPDGWRLRAETVAAIALPPDRVKLRHQGELQNDMLGYLRMRRTRREWRAEVAGGDYKRFLAHAPVPDALDAAAPQGQAQLAVRSAFLALQHNTTVDLKKKRAARDAYRALVKAEKGAVKVRLPHMKDAPTKINIEAVVDFVAPLTALELPEYADQFTEETHPSRR